jgi:hypothetical protein
MADATARYGLDMDVESLERLVRQLDSTRRPS